MPKHSLSLSTLGLDFKQWVAGLKTGDYPEIEVEKLVSFRFWISSLSVKSAGRVAFKIVKLCALPDFDLTWFRSTLQQTEADTHIVHMLTYFGLALYQSWNNQSQLEILSWLNSPQWNRNNKFGWQLYMRLLEAGFIDLPGEFLMDPPKKRAEIIEKTIRKAYTQEYDLLIALAPEIIFLQQYDSNARSLKTEWCSKICNFAWASLSFEAII